MSDSLKSHDASANGWTAVPRLQSKILAELGSSQPAKGLVQDFKLPQSDVAKQTLEYARKELPQKTFNHSMRVYYYGMHHLKRGERD
jgi:cyanamide hydratase